MNIQAGKPRRGARRALPVIGNGAISEPPHDPDVTQLLAAEAEARTVDRQVKVALAAYFIAEKRGFGSGHELDDWLAAEAQIAAAEQASVINSIQPVTVENVS